MKGGSKGSVRYSWRSGRRPSATAETSSLPRAIPTRSYPFPFQTYPWQPPWWLISAIILQLILLLSIQNTTSRQIILMPIMLLIWLVCIAACCLFVCLYRSVEEASLATPSHQLTAPRIMLSCIIIIVLAVGCFVFILFARTVWTTGDRWQQH